MVNGAGVQLWGWDSVNSVWVKVLVNADGKLIIDPSEILEDAPTDGETGKAPTSNWAYDHENDADAHNAPYTEGARVYHNANQTIPHATLTTVAFNQERYDTDSIHNTVTNNSRLTCKTAGKYLIGAEVQWDDNTTGNRYAVIRVNNTKDLLLDFISTPSVGGCVSHTLVLTYALAVNDYVELRVFQGSGGDLNIMAALEEYVQFWMHRIG